MSHREGRKKRRKHIPRDSKLFSPLEITFFVMVAVLVVTALVFIH